MALIFDIKRFSINDGPGIRTTLFLKGCPLHCVWCHNPEGQDLRPQKLYNRQKCIGCQSCVEVCPQHLLHLTHDGIIQLSSSQPSSSQPSYLSPNSRAQLSSSSTCPNSNNALMQERIPLLEDKDDRRIIDERMGGSDLHLEREREDEHVSTPCLLCGRCADECPTLALKMSGHEWPMDELMAVVEKERQVMEDSGGGVTLCGGEPLMHPAYTLELLDELERRGFHRAVDTTLYASPDVIRNVAARCELFLVDLKLMDSQRHRTFTGVPNEPILAGIRLIATLAVPYWIRIPFIEGVNADEDNLHSTATFLASLPKQPEVINLLPYHDIGKGKHAKLGTTYNPDNLPLATPSEEKQQAAIALFASYGLKAKIGG